MGWPEAIVTCVGIVSTVGGILAVLIMMLKNF